MTEDLSNIHMSKAEFQEYGYRLVDWLAEYFDNVDQYQVLPSIEPGDIRKCFQFRLQRSRVNG